MSYLFRIEDKKVNPNPETLLIFPFNEIWDRDKGVNKDLAMKEFAFIEFMTSMLPSNPYRGYSLESKKDKLITDLFHKNGYEKWQPDSLINTGINYLENLQAEGSLSYRYWRANKSAAEKLIDFFENFDMKDVNLKTMNPLYKPKEITSALVDAEKTLQTLHNLQKKVEEELFENVKNKGGKTISQFADPSTIDD